jgi:hypothetical protein
MWVQQLGFLDTAAQQHLPEKDTYPAELMTIDSVYGKVSYLMPPLRFSNLQLPPSMMLMPYGADVPEWRHV